MVEIKREKADKLGFTINYLILIIVVELMTIISIIRCMKFLLVKDFSEYNYWSNNSFRVNFIMAIMFLLISIILSLKPISDKFHNRELNKYTIEYGDDVTDVRVLTMDSRLEDTIFEYIIIKFIAVFIL